MDGDGRKASVGKPPVCSTAAVEKVYRYSPPSPTGAEQSGCADDNVEIDGVSTTKAAEHGDAASARQCASNAPTEDENKRPSRTAAGCTVRPGEGEGEGHGEGEAIGAPPPPPPKVDIDKLEACTKYLKGARSANVKLNRNQKLQVMYLANECVQLLKEGDTVAFSAMSGGALMSYKRMPATRGGSSKSTLHHAVRAAQDAINDVCKDRSPEFVEKVHTKLQAGMKITQDAKKRKPGRPRKSAPTSEEGAPKRKRGRPKKSSPPAAKGAREERRDV